MTISTSQFTARSAVRRHIASWATTRHTWGWFAGIVVIVGIMILPILAILQLALRQTGTSTWPHLAATVLPNALANTLLLAAGTCLVCLVVGTVTAWLVTMHRFPLSGLFDRLLILPLAIPTYIIAFSYAELLDYAGPVQTVLRSTFGWHSPSAYWFPDIRSLPGATLVFASVLYPYVYLSARASFVQQSVCTLEVARTLGRTPYGTFWSVALPLARPALAAGLSLVLMETVNDLGAVQYLGVETLTASIFATWVQRSDLSGAAQLSAVILLLIVSLLMIESYFRRQRRSHHTTGRYRAIPFEPLSGWKAAGAFALTLLPVMTGFVIPVLVLGYHAITYINEWGDREFLAAAANTLLLAAPATAVTILLAVILAYAKRILPGRLAPAAARLSGLGYALPGTVLAIGLLIPLAAADNAVDALARQWFGVSTGLILSGSFLALTLAYTIRFLTVALSGVEAGMERISPNLDAAARTLGETATATLRRVHLPLLTPALAAVALLVFVDSMKELPATLLLRPFGVETLATRVYNLAGIEQFERASPGALLIVVAGLIPLLLLHKMIATGRAGDTG